MYNPAKNRPRTPEELAICVDYFFGIEQQNAQADPKYQPKSREELTRMYSIFLKQEMPEAPAPTTEQLYAQLRSLREVKMAEYDVQVAQLQRDARLGKDVAEKLAAWDAYANALVALTDVGREGAPWDGGGMNTPWPERPA